MKSFLPFFLIVFIIYTVANVYLFIRGWQALEIIGRQRVWFTLVFWIVAYSFFVTQLLHVKGASGVVYEAFFIIGSWWIAVMLYGFLILFALDTLRVVGWAGNIKPDFIYHNYPMAKAIIFGMICFILSIILTVGYIQAHRPRVTHVQIAMDKRAGTLTQLRMVMVSDMHLGYIHGRISLARIVDAINAQKPDLVLLAGDIFDNSAKPVIQDNAGLEFERLQTKYGTFFVTGNHEYIGEREMQIEGAMKTTLTYLSTHGVTPLLDSFLPIIMLDHQPYRFDEVEQAGVDFHLSGHTHYGQMWPLNYVTRRIFEKDWGYFQRGKSHFYVSCGVGTWGPPIRTAGYSEVVVADIKFGSFAYICAH